jgi:hypothetical protein
LPYDNLKLLWGYISQHFSEMPQLLGGNHTTTACYAVLRSHFHENEVSGEKFFKAPGNSNITEDLIWKFKSRQGKVLISPLPLIKPSNPLVFVKVCYLRLEL